MKSKSRIGANAITVATSMTEMTLPLWTLSSLRCVRRCFFMFAVLTLCFVQYSSHYRLVSLIMPLANWASYSCSCDSGYVADCWIMKHQTDCVTWHSGYYAGFWRLPYWLNDNLSVRTLEAYPLYPGFEQIPLFTAYDIQDNINIVLQYIPYTHQFPFELQVLFTLLNFPILIRNCHIACLNIVWAAPTWGRARRSESRIENSNY